MNVHECSVFHACSCLLDPVSSQFSSKRTRGDKVLIIGALDAGKTALYYQVRLLSDVSSSLLTRISVYKS